MKVKIRSVLKTSSHDFECFEDQQIMFPSGNTLCIKEIGRNQSEFICLNKHMQHLYAFKPSTNRKGVFTAEQTQNGVDVAYYTLKGERRSVSLSTESAFFQEVERVQLFVDEYDNSLVYGAARNKDTSCVFLCDISKGKVMAQGYMSHFEDVKVDSRENMTLSICGHSGNFNYIKYLRYGLGQWEIEEFPYKKIDQQHGSAFYHELIFGNRIIIATRTAIYLFEDNDLLQTFQVPEGKRIQSVLKIPRAFLALTEDQTVRVYIEESDEVNFFEKGEIRIQLGPGDSIHKMVLSHTNEEVIVRTTKNHLYTWKCEHIGLDAAHSEMVFMKVESSCIGEKTGHISISTGKRLGMLAGSSTVTIWGLQKNEYVLSSEFSIGEGKGRPILASAISPDGNSFILSFEDRIKIYKILLTKFKSYAQFSIKRCQNIIYSHGGQLVACRYGRGPNSCIQIINLLRLCEVNTIKVQCQPLQIIWNELDDELVISGENQVVQIYKVSENMRYHNIRFDQPISHVRYDYRVRKILVSVGEKIAVVDGGDVIDEIVPPIEQFHYVYPLYGIYFVVSKTGVLYWSSSLRFEKYGQYSLFPQSFHLVCRNSYILAYTSFQDVLILECIRENFQKRANDNDIVLVQRDEIQGIFDKIKILESNFDMLQTATQVKLEEEKNNYEAALQKFKAQFGRQIKFLNGKFSELSASKLKQERETEKVFEEVENGQNRSVNELERMFNRKIAIEKQRYMNLQQSSLQERLAFQKAIYELQAKYHQQVTQVRQNYAKKMKEEFQRAEDVKRHNLEDKQRIQMKLLDLEEENEVAITNIQGDKDLVIEQLSDKIKYLEAEYDTLLIKFHNLEEHHRDIKDEHQSKDFDIKRLNANIEEYSNRIRLLQKEAVLKDAMIEEKNQVVNELTHQIGGLQKAKYVLSFRTTEIRKELEPKQSLIDNLKSQLFKLDEQFKQQKKRVFQLKQKIEKLETINETMKKENIETKATLKQKERIHDELCFQIFMIINTIDQKDWNNSFVKIYQSYIKEDKFKHRQVRKKDHTSEEINRHLIHVEQSLFQITSGNNKSLKRKEEEITKKMQENSLLLYELNVMRKNEKDYDKEKKEMGVALDRLKREINDTYKSSNVISTRAHTAKTGMTRRITASREAMTREKSALLEINDFDPSKQKSGKSRNKARSRISSANKTMAIRNVDKDQVNKFFDIAKDLQSCRNTIKIQDELIEQLNHRLLNSQEKQK